MECFEHCVALCDTNFLQRKYNYFSNITESFSLQSNVSVYIFYEKYTDRWSVSITTALFVLYFVINYTIYAWFLVLQKERGQVYFQSVSIKEYDL